MSQLEGDGNYHGWAKMIQNVLATKNKFIFPSGLIHVPKKYGLKFVVWEICNNQFICG